MGHGAAYRLATPALWLALLGASGCGTDIAQTAVYGASSPTPLDCSPPSVAPTLPDDPHFGGGTSVSEWVLATGDYGALDGDGFLTLAGRRDDMITCAGHHFFPADLELEIGAIVGVVHYLCAGVPDPVLGQVPWAFVVADGAPGPAVILAFLTRARRALPPHMVPRRVVVIPQLPTLPSGKPDRRRTVELYA